MCRVCLVSSNQVARLGGGGGVRKFDSFIDLITQVLLPEYDAVSLPA
jgi:hypothetical protein